MVFLKRIEAQGFKSYAELNKINFDASFIGIVGANGSGKTNVVDAIRWVLGENSAKQLRAENNNEIIFYGSNSHEPSNFASVTLVFDNTQRLLKIDKDEVAIKRVLKRNNGSSDYYINEKITHLNEIKNLFLNTGLSKGSLGIISQGMVQKFVDDKPEERRFIFEEAAGVSFYIKSKKTHVLELQHIEENLKDLDINLKILNKQITELNKQANLAKDYLQTKTDLQKYDLFFCKKTYLIYSQKIEELKQKLAAKNTLQNQLQTTLNHDNSQFLICKQHQEEQEKLLAELTQQKFDILEQLKALQEQKVQYETSLNLQLSSQDLNIRIHALNEQINNYQNQLNSWNTNLKTQQLQLEKTKQALTETQNQITQLEKTVQELNFNWNQLNNKLKYAQERKINELKNQSGVKAILDNPNAVPGLIDQLKHLIHSKDESFNTAIELALNKNLNTLVVNTVEDAKLGIAFLKRNHCGVASFMPLNGLKPANLPNNILLIANNFDGFIGTANTLITTEPKYEIVLQTLIGAILVVDTLNTATLLAKAVNYSYKIISLDGEIINRGGLMIGGSKENHSNSVLNQETQEKNWQIQCDELKQNIEQKNQLLQNWNQKKQQLIQNYNNYQINCNTTNNQIHTITENLNSLQSQLNGLQITNSTFNKMQTNQIVQKLNELNIQKNNVETQYENTQITLKQAKQQFDDLTYNIQKNNELKNVLVEEIAQLNQNIYQAQALINNAKEIANNYKYTIENVVKEIPDLDISDTELLEKKTHLKAKLENFGPINMNAVKDLEDKNQQQKELMQNIEDVKTAENNLNQIIANIDQEVSDSFKRKIDEVNRILPQIFKQLFNEGTCELTFTNPDDLLNTGIEVFVKTPGKKIKRLQVLSGGEKAIISLSILLTLLKTSNFPLVILDEAESALDPKNAEAFAKLLTENSELAQFIVVTHRKETMVHCDKLLGATMHDGVTTMYKVNLKI